MGLDKDVDSHGSVSDLESISDKEVSSISIYKESKKKYKCTYKECNAAFVRPSKLARHINIHTNERPYKCDFPGCEKTYTNPSHLKRHVETHNLARRIYTCPQCSLALSNPHNLKRHCERVHEKKNKIFCKICNAIFRKKHRLVEHMNEHGEAASYTCTKCNKSFMSSRRFKLHGRIHESRKTYTCTVPQCTEVFDKWLSLCTHLSTKHVNNYECAHCEKTFFTKSRLRAHTKIHTEDRPVIACPYENCHKSYYFKRNLEHHIRMNHLGKKFYCDICNAGLSSKQRIIEHIKNVHSIKKKRKTKSQRKKRKDTGVPKKSVISALVGINVPANVEKAILQRKTRITPMEEATEINASNEENETM